MRTKPDTRTQSPSGEGTVATVVCFCSSVTFVLLILLSLDLLMASFGWPFCLLVDCDRFLVLLCRDVGICFFCILLEIKRKQFLIRRIEERKEALKQRRAARANQRVS